MEEGEEGRALQGELRGLQQLRAALMGLTGSWGQWGILKGFSDVERGEENSNSLLACARCVMQNR